MSRVVVPTTHPRASRGARRADPERPASWGCCGSCARVSAKASSPPAVSPPVPSRARPPCLRLPPRPRHVLCTLKKGRESLEL